MMAKYNFGDLNKLTDNESEFILNLRSYVLSIESKILEIVSKSNLDKRSSDEIQSDNLDVKFSFADKKSTDLLISYDNEDKLQGSVGFDCNIISDYSCHIRSCRERIERDLNELMNEFPSLVDIDFDYIKYNEDPFFNKWSWEISFYIIYGYNNKKLSNGK